MEKTPNTPPPKPPGWIHELHSRSWEMELLIVGFSLLVLLQVPDWLMELIEIWSARTTSQIMLSFIPLGFMLVVGAKIMTVNLVVHIILRGYWIGIIGLNSVYPDGIRLQNLSYAPRFQTFLATKVKDLQASAVTVDKICSGIFAFTFLLIFLFVSIGLYILALLAILLVLSPLANWLLGSLGKSTIRSLFFFVIVLPYLFGGLLYAIDFLSLGWFKKIRARWFATPFWYISRFFRAVTLASLYESIYYTLISNISKKVIGAVLLLCILSISSWFYLNYQEHIFFPNQRSQHLMQNIYYADRSPDIFFVKRPRIPSNIIHDGFIELFLPYDIEDNDSLKTRCPDVKYFQEEGLSTAFRVRFNIEQDSTGIVIGGRKKTVGSNIRAALECISSLYSISIDDSIYQDLDFYFYKYPNANENGIITYISTEGLKKGNHLLTIRKNLAYQLKREQAKNTHFIPFWVK